MTNRKESHKLSMYDVVTFYSLQINLNILQILNQLRKKTKDHKVYEIVMDLNI